MSRMLCTAVILLGTLGSSIAAADMEIPTIDSIKQTVQDSKKSALEASDSVKDTLSKALPPSQAVAKAAPGSKAAPLPTQLIPAPGNAPAATTASAPAQQPAAAPLAPAKDAPKAASLPENLPLPPADTVLKLPTNDPSMLPSPGNAAALTPTPAADAPPAMNPPLINAVPTTVPPVVVVVPPAAAQASATVTSGGNATNNSPDNTIFPSLPNPSQTATSGNKSTSGGKSHAHRKARHYAENRYKHIRLPETLYRRNYDPMNKHLPEAYYERDLDELLLLAARENNLDGVRAMLDYDKRSINTRSAVSGETPLIAAVRNNAFNIVTLLLGRHADVHIRDAQGMSALDYARGLGLDHMATLIEMKGRDRVRVSRQ